ncbi:MAG: hypothetical protein PHS59_12095 [Paludibacter sp.]|nr:hypothetical protein [Paludibacter sp.]
MQKDKRCIYILECGLKQRINKKSSSYKIEVLDEEIVLPEEIEKEVNENWENFSLKNPDVAKDKGTYFFAGYDEIRKTDYVFMSKFRYVQAFGRTKEFEKYACYVSANHITALSSLCLVLTTDNKLVFGVKENMNGNVSGFSGYLDKQFVEERQVALYKYLSHSILEELSVGIEDVKAIYRTGQTYSPNISHSDNQLNNKVYNNTFLILLELTSKEVEEKFESNFQFSRLLFIENNEEALIKWTCENQSNISIHCIGAIYNYLIYCDATPYASDMIKSLHCSIIVQQNVKQGVDTVRNIIKRLGIFNWGLIGGARIKEYSVAPFMWNALFDYLKFPINYFIISEDEPQPVMDKLNKMILDNKLVGANIAMPWKHLIFDRCNSVEIKISDFGVINTIILDNGILKGYNTDGEGLVKAVTKKIKLEDASVLILGAGGGSMTLPFYLLKSGVKKIFIYDINEDNLDNLLDKYDQLIGNHLISKVTYNQLEKILKNIDLLVNATPCGMVGHENELVFSKKLIRELAKSACVAEMVYNPYETQLLQLVSNKNQICRGINMLVEQAALSFHKGFGVELTYKEKQVMKEAAKAALGER